VAGAFFYCSKAGLQRRVVRVEGILDGSMYIGKPNHLYIQRNLNIKLFTAKEPAKMPNIQWNGVTATTPSGKAVALSNRFYPIVEADLTDLTDYEFIGRTPMELHIACTVTE
jgi:hypothetical protein